MVEPHEEDAEGRRIAELQAYGVLDTDPEPAFDDLVQAAAFVADTPMALVTLIDEERQWFKASLGVDVKETPREIAFCDHAVRDRAELIVPDATLDVRFSENPFVVGEPHIAFYAGFPLRTPSGAVLGTLCVLHQQPTALTEQQLFILRTLADQVMTQLHLRKEALEREVLIEQLTRSEARYRSLVEHSEDIIARLRPDGVIDYVSPALTAVLGVDPATAIGSDLLIQAMHPQERPRLVQALERATRGSAASFSGRVQHAAGNWRHLEFTLLPLGRSGRDEAREISCTARDLTDRVEAEVELSLAHTQISERGRQLEEAQRIAGVGSFSYEIVTGQMAWSPELKRIFGVDPDTFTLTFESYLNMIHPDDRDRLLACLTTAQQNGTDYEIEHRLIRPDGEERVLHGRGQVQTDSFGTAIRISGTGQDVTSARRNQQALQAARDLFAQVLANTEQSIIVTDIEGAIIIFNRGAERMLGYTAAEMLGRSPAEFHDRDEILVRAAELGVEPGFAVFVTGAEAEQSQSREWIYVAKDGVRRQVQLTVTSMHASGGELTGYIGVATDITTQREAEHDRDAHARMLRAVIENNQSMIYVKDLEGRYLMANQALEVSLGLNEADLIGRTDDVHNPDLAPIWRANDLLALNGPQQLIEYNDLPDGRHWYQSVKLPLRDADGRIYATCGMSLDITERRKADAEIARAVREMTEARDAAIAATKVKSSFLATMSHEIRTPLNAVVGMTDLLLATDLDSPQRQYAETVRTSGDALLAVINDILDYSRFEAGGIDLENYPFNLRQCLEDSLSLVALAAAALDLVLDIDSGCPQVLRGDAGKLRQVLVNLVGNAIKFTERGEVLVTVTASEANAEQMAGEPVPITLSFSVRDTGIGIPPDRMDRLFKSFSQVDASTTRVYGGAGLGLVISQAIVQAMGGIITVASDPAIGSTFRFTITLAQCSPEDVAALADEHPVTDFSGVAALVVDDNETNRRILTLQLEGLGVTVTALASGRDALDVLLQGQAFDVAVLDYCMPHMDGAQLAEQIRALPSAQAMPMILLTSLGSTPILGDGPFAGHHTKPIRLETLRQLVAEVLGRSSAPRPTTEGLLIPAPRSGSTLRILLAEDNLVNQRVAQGMLGNLGHVVEIAADGLEALRALQRTDYDVVLMDLHMPNLNGLEATRAIRTQIPLDRQPYIIAMTASFLPEDKRACHDAGILDYLLKPVRAVDLEHTLNSIPWSETISGRKARAAGASNHKNASDHETASDHTAAVDLRILAQLAAEIGDLSGQAQQQLIQAYLQQADQWITEFGVAARQRNPERVRQIAHTLGSSSAILGAFELAKLLAEAERLVRSEAADLVPIATTSAAEYLRVASLLRSHRDSLLTTESD